MPRTDYQRLIDRGRKAGLGHFQACSGKKQRLPLTGDAVSGRVQKEDMMQILLGQLLAIFCKDSRLIADQIHIFWNMKGVVRHAGGQVAVMTGGQVNRPKGQDDAIAIDGD